MAEGSLDVGPGIERRCYVEGESCGDETYCGCEEMHHIDFLLGILGGICLYMGSVLANVGSCSRPAAGQKGFEITEEQSA